MIRAPRFRLVYEGRDITSDLAQHPLSIVYTDRRHGESDEVTVKVHNVSGAWLDEWMPADGDKFTLEYGYDGEMVPAGTFTVDEFSATGDAGGDVVDFKGLAAASTATLRTRKSRAFEEQQLSDIVNKIALEHGYDVEGEIDDLGVIRITQNGERDLEFLRRLADDYGHYFAVKGDKLVFTSRDGLRARDPVRTLDRLADRPSSILNYDLRSADHQAAKKAEVRYSHPRRKSVIAGDASSAEDLGVMTASGDIVKIDVRVESEEQAQRLAKSRLDTKNSQKETGRLTLVGDPVLVAGAVVELTSFGKFGGRYLIASSTHRIVRSGYTTEIELERATAKQQADGKAVKSKPTTKKKGASAAPAPTDGYLGEMGADGVLRR